MSLKLLSFLSSYIAAADRVVFIYTILTLVEDVPEQAIGSLLSYQRYKDMQTYRNLQVGGLCLFKQETREYDVGDYC